MIRIQNLDQIQDDESITCQRFNQLFADAQLSPKIVLKSFRSRPQKNISQKVIYTHKEFPINDSQNSQDQLNTNPSNIKRNKALTTRNDTILYPNVRRQRKQLPWLKQIIAEQKIKIIVRNFINKLKRNSTEAKPVEYTPFSSDKELAFLDTQGMELHENVIIGLSMFSTLLIIVLSIIYTLSLVFQEVSSATIVKDIQAFSLVFYLLEVGINLVTVKFEQGKRLGTLRQIWNYYVRNTLVTDIICVLVIFIDLLTSWQATTYLRLLIIVKMSQGLQKLQKLQIYFIHNFYYQQYWSLLKVFLFNFSLAHVLAIALVAMASINPNDNWMNQKDISIAEWYQKYVWAYYWATTIMLTVGFGDLTATNYNQAMVIAMVEMISCIALAYNINCVGTLISNIRSQDQEKSKNFKVFHKLSNKNDLPDDLEWRINNYIEESSNIKKKFNHEEENLFVEKLPKGLKTEFLKESNKKIFQYLPFFKNLMQRTLFSFAEKIEMHICHPEEIIQHIDDPHNLLILKGGQIGFTCKKPGCEFNSTVIDQLKIKNISQPILVSLGFIRGHNSIYEIKSLEYSILYFLDHETILSILRGSDMDYELYCLLRDKSSHIPDEYELFRCQICKGKHTKFTCPKLHFIPIKQQVANKFMHKFKTGKCVRDKLFKRYDPVLFNALKTYPLLNKFQQKKQSIIKEKKSTVKRRSNIVNQMKKFQHMGDNSSSLTNEISQIKDFFSRNAAQLIKQQLNKALQHKIGHDEVWIVQSDKMRDYKNYFQVDNSCNLMYKFVNKQTGETTQEQWSQIQSRRLLGSGKLSENEMKKQLSRSLNSVRKVGSRVSEEEEMRSG